MMPVGWEILLSLKGLSGNSGRQERACWVWKIPSVQCPRQLAISPSDSEAMQLEKAQTLESANLGPSARPTFYVLIT